MLKLQTISTPMFCSLVKVPEGISTCEMFMFFLLRGHQLFFSSFQVTYGHLQEICRLGSQVLGFEQN